MARSPVIPSLPVRPVTFTVGSHEIVVTKVAEHRWTAAVDGRPLDGSHNTQAEAWESGVRAASKIDAGG
ncbi:MAG: hypothetical protein U0229_05490 [Anaeromyxobacter sp.]